MKKCLFFTLTICGFFLKAQNVLSDTLGLYDSSQVTFRDSIVEFYLPEAVDFAPDYEDTVIKSRIASIDSDLPLRFDRKIRLFIDYFTIRNRDYTRKMIRRSKLYFPIFEEILADNNMPESIKYLAIVESGLDPKIRSWAGAMGLWQFMPVTGKAYGLQYDYYIDERLDPYKSTQAACKYLKQLYNMFGDWELALGAYNCGPGNMRKAIRKSGYKSTFAEVYNYLPKETRSYVPQFMAVNYVMRFAEEHNLFVEDWEYESVPDFDTLVCNQYVDLNKLVQFSSICIEDVEKLNPAIKRNTISTDWTDYQLKLPLSFFDLSEDSIASILVLAQEKGEEGLNYNYRNPYASDLVGTEEIIYRVRSGDNLGAIANKYNVRVSQIKVWNGLRGSTIYPGQRLKIQVKKLEKTSSTKSTETKTVVVKEKKTVPKGEKVSYIVKRGDVLSTIADTYSVSVSELKSWNGLSGNKIYIGQELVIYGEEAAPEVTVSMPQVVEEEKEKDYSSYKTTSYTVVSGDALYTIALNYNMTVDDLKGLNNLTSNDISVGQVLLVFDNQVTQSEIEETVSVTKEYLYHEVKKGESLWSIAQQYEEVSIDSIKKLNGLTSNNLDVGQKLKIKLI